MRILVFGKTGQVARSAQALAPVLALSREEADLSDPQACAEAIRQHAPSAVINAAAYTAVDKAEEEEELAAQINGMAPAAMASACADLQIPFVHISTDYVFDGEGDSPFLPQDKTSPISAYGRSKRLGEDGVAAAGGISAILRTSWVFSSYGQNFVKTMLRLGADRDRIAIVADQFGGPTPASGIAAACLKIARQLAIDPNKAGCYHYAGAPDTSWAWFAREIFAQAGLDCDVSDIATLDYPTPAPRPLNSRLDCSATEAAFGIARPDWRSELRVALRQITNKEN